MTIMRTEAEANEERRCFGAKTLGYYTSINDAGYDEDVEVAATDLVADLIHYISTIPTINPATVLDRALNHYMDEIGGEL